MDLDDIKDKATDLIDEHGDKLKDGIDKAAGFADDKTGGKHGDKIDSVAEQAKGMVDRLGSGDESTS
jgi:hypothetical protein